MNQRATKIIVTFGPSSADPSILREFLMIGVEGFRFNFSHADYEFFKKGVETLKNLERELGKCAILIQDLGGPKLRIGEVEKPFEVKKEDILEIYSYPVESGYSQGIGRVYLEMPEILERVEPGVEVTLADGYIRGKVIKKEKEKIICKIIHGGPISSRKGINFIGIELPLSALTSKDMEDLKFGASLGFDYVAVSFVSTAEDVKKCKELLKDLGSSSWVIAKIEKKSALENLEEILEVADGVMIARGDLGIEVPLEKVPVLQKKIINKAVKRGKLVIVATQMLTSMVNAPFPTRAEVSDIANAVWDSADALMLSDETAAGRYPLEAVKVMQKVIEESERYSYERISQVSENIRDRAIASSAVYLAEQLKSRAIVVLTQTGESLKRVSQLRPKVPILVITHKKEVLRKLALLRGVIPLGVIDPQEDITAIFPLIKNFFLSETFQPEDTIVLTYGYPLGIPGTTNTIKVLKISEIEKVDVIV
ncbi:MAG: pyruvate kinase [Caldimicrobium sp.]